VVCCDIVVVVSGLTSVLVVSKVGALVVVTGSVAGKVDVTSEVVIEVVGLAVVVNDFVVAASVVAVAGAAVVTLSVVIVTVVVESVMLAVLVDVVVGADVEGMRGQSPQYTHHPNTSLYV